MTRARTSPGTREKMAPTACVSSGESCTTGTEVETATYTGAPAQHITTVSSGDLSEGANTIRVCVTDAAGNQDSQTTSVAKDTAERVTLTFGPQADARVEEANPTLELRDLVVTSRRGRQRARHRELSPIPGDGRARHRGTGEAAPVGHATGPPMVPPPTRRIGRAQRRRSRGTTAHLARAAPPTTRETFPWTRSWSTT